MGETVGGGPARAARVRGVPPAPVPHQGPAPVRQAGPGRAAVHWICNPLSQYRIYLGQTATDCPAVDDMLTVSGPDRHTHRQVGIDRTDPTGRRGRTDRSVLYGSLARARGIDSLAELDPAAL